MRLISSLKNRGLWAAILMLTVLCRNAHGLWAARFFLGFVEASIAPSMSLIISMWYKRSEQPLRQSAWFMGNVIGGLVGGLLGYGVGHINGIAAWKVRKHYNALPQKFRSLIVLSFEGTLYSFWGHYLGLVGDLLVRNSRQPHGRMVSSN